MLSIIQEVITMLHFLLFLILMVNSSVGEARRKHMSAIYKQTDVSIEQDTYSSGSYYYPTIMQTIGEVSIGLSGQNISTWDTQDSIYGVIGWTHLVNHNLSISIGSMIGSTIKDPSLDSYYYGLMNYQVNRYLNVAAGPYMESSRVGYQLTTTVTFQDTQLQFYDVSGNQNMSGIGVNLLYQVSSNYQPYIGYGYQQYHSYLALGINFNFDE